MKTLLIPSFAKRALIFFFLPVLLTVLFTRCQKDTTVPDEANSTFPGILAAVSGCTYTPCVVPAEAPTNPDPTGGQGGNANCPDGYEFSSGRYPGEEDDELAGGDFGTFGPISWEISEDGKYLSWCGNVCGLVVIVKGGNDAYQYTYDATCKAGEGLYAPDNGGGNIPDISNITFCWNACVEVECDEETGFGGNYKGAGKAWWYYYDTQGPACQNIYAGQNLMAGGSVCFDGTNFNVTLGTGWSLDIVDNSEAVKAQGYNTLPSNRPASGLFTLYKGNELEFQGNGSRYYVIHLDLLDCN